MSALNGVNAALLHCTYLHASQFKKKKLKVGKVEVYGD
jgi:hypothetical protein